MNYNNSGTHMQSMHNHFLLAMPQLDDDNFADALVYLCDHDDKGILGVMINRPLALSVGELLAQLSLDTHNASEAVLSGTVLYGGPVHHDRGFVLHNDPGARWSSSLQVTDQVALTTSLDILNAIANGDGPEQFLICLGCAGWEVDQWVDEIKANTWLTVPGTPEILFDTDVADRREAAAHLLGIDLAQLSNSVGHA